MGDIAARGNRLTFAKGGRAGHALGQMAGRLLTKTLERVGGGPEGKPHSTKKGRIAAGARRIKRVKKFGGGRTNLLEQLGRVEAEPSNPNRRAEISRVHGELNRGYAKGGRAGFSVGSSVGRHLKKGTELVKEHLARKEAKKVQAGKDKIQKSEMGYAVGGAVRKLGRALKGRKGRGKDFKTQGKDIPTMAAKGGRIGLKKGGSDKKWIQKAVDPKHKGYCTPMTKKTCTPARKALARTFKKKAKTGW